MSDAIVFDRHDLIACMDGRGDATIDDVWNAIRHYSAQGFRLLLSAGLEASNDPSGSVGPQDMDKLMLDLRRLDDAGIRFDGVSFRGPARTDDDMMIDDKLVTLEEFVSLAPEAIAELLDEETRR